MVAVGVAVGGGIGVGVGDGDGRRGVSGGEPGASADVGVACWAIYPSEGGATVTDGVGIAGVGADASVGKLSIVGVAVVAATSCVAGVSVVLPAGRLLTTSRQPDSPATQIVSNKSPSHCLIACLQLTWCLPADERSPQDHVPRRLWRPRPVPWPRRHSQHRRRPVWSSGQNCLACPPVLSPEVTSHRSS
jgi:hypothetical protein